MIERDKKETGTMYLIIQTNEGEQGSQGGFSFSECLAMAKECDARGYEYAFCSEKDGAKIYHSPNFNNAWYNQWVTVDLANGS